MSKQNPIPDLSASEISHLIDEWILNERDRKILKRRMIDGICFEPLSEEFGMSRNGIRDICIRSQDILYKHV